MASGRAYLVAREAEDDKVLVLVLVVELLKTFVLGREAAVGGDPSICAARERINAGRLTTGTQRSRSGRPFP